MKFTAFIALFMLWFSSARSLEPKSSVPDQSTIKGNILFIAPVSSKSHKNFYYGLIEAIVNDGHKVTLLTPYKPSKTLQNVREIVYEENNIDKMMVNAFQAGPIAPMLSVIKHGPEMCFNTLGSNITKDILKEQFDLAFVSMFFADCFLPELHSKKIPFVFVNPAEMMGPFSGARIGNPTFPSFDYNLLLAYTPPLTFFQRALSTLVETAIGGMYYFQMWQVDRTGRQLGLIPEDSPSITEIATDASLMIANSFRLAEHPRPYMPNILLAGGIHCKPPGPLPQDLEAWVQSSGDAGFIYFSLGSAVRAGDLPDETIEILKSVFESLPQKVLWKFNLDSVKGGLPENVRLTKWAPQQDLLGHPKLRLFMTHGGVFSTQESTFHGVQVLGLPVFGDQASNMMKAEANGWGKMLRWEELSYDLLRNTILELINDKKKREVSRVMGQVVRDQPSSPAADVAWWTGYLLRTKGAKHLQSGARHLRWYELYNTDVWLFFIASDILFIWVMKKFLMFLYRRCCRSKSSSNKRQKKKRE